MDTLIAPVPLDFTLHLICTPSLHLKLDPSTCQIKPLSPPGSMLPVKPLPPAGSIAPVTLLAHAGIIAPVTPLAPEGSIAPVTPLPPAGSIAPVTHLPPAGLPHCPCIQAAPLAAKHPALDSVWTLLFRFALSTSVY